VIATPFFCSGLALALLFTRGTKQLNRLYAFDRKMRQVQPAWSYKMRSYIHASPVVVGDTVLVASFEGAVYALRQAKPIRVWKDEDIVPRWFVAALSREMHKSVSELITRASSGKVGEELSLRKFEAVFGDIRGGAKGDAPKVLPSDVPIEHPGASFIEYALTSGLLTGYPDGSFRPNEPTNRYQFSFGLATVLQTVTRPDFAWKTKSGQAGAQVEVRVKPQLGRSQVMPRDVNANHWAYEALTALAPNALIPMDEDGNYRGNKGLTLKDAAAHWNLFVDTLKVVRIK
ncbi:MAG: S-layer homology domain-containing protein, partial [Fimbriimonadaceae bacterium]